MKEPVITCTPQGEMTVQSDVLEMLNLDFNIQLVHIKDSMAKCHAIMKHAQMCHHNKDEHSALRYCEMVMSIVVRNHFLQDYGKEAAQMIREVDSMLCSLTSSDNEYVWEVASQREGDLRCRYPKLVEVV